MIIDGRALATGVLARAKARAAVLGRRPNVLAYVAPEETAATRSYLKIKARSAEEAGCDFEETRSLAPSSRADGFIIQLPLPSDADTKAILDAIPVSQDADVLSALAREKFERGDADALLPPVVAAVREIFEKNNVAMKGKKAVVIGAGFLVGAPCATWLTQEGAEVTIVTVETPEEETVAALRAADIVVSGAGSPHFIKPDMLKPGVVLIDAGTSESSGRVVGDADPACADKCSLFTPVPGGVGPLAVACLFENAVTLAENAIHT
ncbi:MAG: bifunctional 5,10-methylenetetrahydrofolate dehydrogenase/5,10-methenyltetrahydrofolate cyclohydrolase [Minisyncoccia bacterium]